VTVVPDARDGLWSPELESWLVPDGKVLRLFDKAGQRRLTEAEAEVVARQEAEARLAELLCELRERGIDPDQLDAPV
jgi:hypothetical protein